MEGSPRPSTALAALLVALLAALPGCRAPESTAARDARHALARLVYPATAEHGPDLDIAVERRGETLHLYNRTARAYRDHQLWLNRQYVNTVALIAVGPDNTLALPRWINRYAEPFPVGSLLTPDNARAVVLAELYNPQTNRRHRLTTWPNLTDN